MVDDDEGIEWLTIELPEILEFREGPGIMARDFRSEGVPLLRLAGLKRGAPLLNRCNYLDPTMVDRKWTQFRLRLRDVLLSTSASLGEVAVVDESAVGAVPYTGIIAFRSRDGRILPEFIQYALTAPSFKRQVEAMGVGSVLRHFGPMHLRQMTIAVPPLTEQRAIAEVLGALDDKIEANRQRTRLLDEYVQQTYLAAVQMATEVVQLRDLVQPGLGGVWGDDSPTSELDVLVRCLRGVDLASLSNGELPEPPLRWLHAKPFEQRAFENGEIWVEGSGSFCGRSLLVDTHVSHLYDVPIRNSNFVKRLRPKVSFEASCWAWLSMRQAYNDGEFVQWRTGSAFPNLDLSGLLNGHIVLMPPKRTLEHVAELVKLRSDPAPMLESQALARLRDALLPRLLSGELRVRDAEAAVEGAV